jgi:hypothetical protein
MLVITNTPSIPIYNLFNFIILNLISLSYLKNLPKIKKIQNHKVYYILDDIIVKVN